MESMRVLPSGEIGEYAFTVRFTGLTYESYLV